MGRKSTYSFEQKLYAAQKYLSREAGATQIAREIGIPGVGAQMVRRWAKRYQTHGEAGLRSSGKHKHYPEELKDQVVREYLDGMGSYSNLAEKHGIASDVVILYWVRRYNNRSKDANKASSPEETTMKAKKTMTLKERAEVAQYCLDHNKNYTEAAAKYGCSYAQARNWTLKYEQEGKDGLVDGRGRTKAEEELTEEEKQRKIIARLEQENQRLRMENELLKKADEWERRAIAGKVSISASRKRKK